jgi:two-component system nitrogen regulation response regulator NtrX
MASEICVLDDDPAFLQDLRVALAGAYEVKAFSDSPAFRKSFTPRRFDLIVLDMCLEGEKEGLEVLREIHQADPYQAVVVATAYADTETYLETLQAGALLYVDKTRHTPEAMALLFDAVIQQGRLRREQAAASRALDRMDPSDIVGASEPVRQLRSQIERLSGLSPRLVVIAGETGSGRELAARNLHARRFRGTVPPLPVLPRQTLPAADILRQLTGRRTGESIQRGLLEDAHGSGLVVRCSDRLPVEVLKFLIQTTISSGFQSGGCNAFHPFDAVLYLICEDPEGITRFINGEAFETIRVPPLRERKEDIPLLATYLLEAQRKRGREGAGTLDSSAMSSLLAHDWPGNVAELRIALEYAGLRAMADKADVINRKHLAIGVGYGLAQVGRWDLEYREARTQVELVEEAIHELATTNKTKLSGFLDVQTPTTLTRRIERALQRYPELCTEYPRTADAFGRSEVMHQS